MLAASQVVLELDNGYIFSQNKSPDHYQRYWTTLSRDGDSEPFYSDYLYTQVGASNSERLLAEKDGCFAIGDPYSHGCRGMVIVVTLDAVINLLPEAVEPNEYGTQVEFKDSAVVATDKHGKVTVSPL